MEEKYYVISNIDGEVYINEYNREELLELINKEYETINLDSIPNKKITLWGKERLIIKGKLVVPAEKDNK